VEVVIKDADSRDFEILWRIDQQCFAPGIAYSKRELATYMALRGSFTILATDPEEKILGFLVATLRHHGIGHVITIDVINEARRSGVGSKLLAEAERRLRQLK